MFKDKIRSLMHQAEPFKNEISLLSSFGCNVKFCPDEALEDYEKDTENGIPSYSRHYTVLYAWKEIHEKNEILDIHIELILTDPELSCFWSVYIISSVPDRISDTNHSFSSSISGHFQALSLESLLSELNDFLTGKHIRSDV